MRAIHAILIVASGHVSAHARLWSNQVAAHPMVWRDGRPAR